VRVLGIETSCDETAAAVVEDGRRVLSNVVYSQIARHQPYGGVVPEIASRAHLETLPGVLDEALRQAGVDWSGLDGLAVTYGPGLASSLLIGLTMARALALRLDKPCIGINHLEAHLYSIFLPSDRPSSPDLRPLTSDLRPLTSDLSPLLVLLVTGGHTALIRMEGVGRYRLLGQTRDDAAGEALDKGAKLLGLGYPGGPAMEKAAGGGDPAFIDFPRGLIRRADAPGAEDPYAFSFSGLKTALLYYLRDHPEAAGNGGLKDIAASYQEAVFDALADRAERALRREDVGALACVGGVARNQRLRSKLADLAARHRVPFHIAPFEYCTDNAAMVAALAGRLNWSRAPSAHDLDVQPGLALPSG
jgi:N6-L-threonylcarbamoyladenine synthase